MYQLTGENKSGERIVLDDIPDDFAEEHGAEYCGQYWPNYKNFELKKLPENINSEN